MGEVSVTSMNLLAPFYNSLSMKFNIEEEDYNDDEVIQRQNSLQQDFLKQDRSMRMPQVIRMAKQTNADIFCLQESEGTYNNQHHDDDITIKHNHGLSLQVEELLAQNKVYRVNSSDDETTTIVIEGYDSYVWCPLMPNNKRGDIV
jgi:hypothetical protein